MPRFARKVVVDDNGTPLAGAVGKIYDVNDTANTTPLAVFSVSGAPFSLNEIIANNDGVTPEFNHSGPARCKWVSGSYEEDMIAWDIYPLGGSAGQQLIKGSSADFDFDWASPYDYSTVIELWARYPEPLFVNSITRDANNIPTSAQVRWPDGSLGLFTALIVNSEWKTVDSYEVTRPVAGGTFTYLQPAMTRNTSGYITLRPDLVVSFV